MASRGGRSGSGALLRAHRALSRSADQAGARRRTPAPMPIGKARAAPRRRRSRDHLVRRVRPRRRCASPSGSPRTASRRACSICASLAPLDRDALLAVARHCSRVLIVHEDSRTGGIGESLAAIIQEEAFESLDAPIRIIGALDTPVPYSPPLEEFYLRGEAEIDARRALARRVLTSPGPEASLVLFEFLRPRPSPERRSARVSQRRHVDHMAEAHSPPPCARTPRSPDRCGSARPPAGCRAWHRIEYLASRAVPPIERSRRSSDVREGGRWRCRCRVRAARAPRRA